MRPPAPSRASPTASSGRSAGACSKRWACLVPEKRAVEGADRSQERRREQEQVAVLPDPPPVADHHPAPPVSVAVVPEGRVAVRRGLPRAVEARDGVASVRGEPEVLTLTRAVEGGDVVGVLEDLDLADRLGPDLLVLRLLRPGDASGQAQDQNRERQLLQHVSPFPRKAIRTAAGGGCDHCYRPRLPRQGVFPLT